MPRGPLPSPDRRRRNAPSIPTTTLDASGRKGRAPRVPVGYEMGEAGSAWWRWAWSLPQALAWSTGDLYLIARRAQLEDSKAAIREVGEFDLEQVLGQGLMDPDEMTKMIRRLVGELRSIAGGVLAIEREMREIDDRLGLTPKGLAALRWKIVAPQPASGEASPSGSKVSNLSSRRARLFGCLVN